MFSGLPDSHPDPLVTRTDSVAVPVPVPDPDPSFFS
jgi:hypothetical protein